MSFFEVIINEAIIDDVIEYSEMVISMCRWIEFDLLGALSPQIIHYPLLWPNRIKVWDEIPVEEQDKGLQVLIMSEKGREGGREGWPFSLTLFIGNWQLCICYSGLFVM